MLGIFFIVVGVVSLAYVRNSSKLDRVGIYWALATGAAIAVYTVVDGIGVRRSHDALRYAVVLFVLQSTLWLIGVVVRRGWRWTDKASTITVGLVAGLMSLVAYTVVLYAQTRAPLGIVSALARDRCRVGRGDRRRVLQGGEGPGHHGARTRRGRRHRVGECGLGDARRRR